MQGPRAEPGWDGVDPSLIFSPAEGVVPGWRQGLHDPDSVLPQGESPLPHSGQETAANDGGKYPPHPC